jgi:hypothetical protein
MAYASIKSTLPSKANLFVATCVLALAAAMAPAVAVASTLTVTNQSNSRIDHVYVSLSKSSAWGPDRLVNDVLLYNYHTSVAVSDGWYDVEFVDSLGRSCRIDNVNLHADTAWILTDAYLLNCESKHTGNN